MMQLLSGLKWVILSVSLIGLFYFSFIFIIMNHVQNQAIANVWFGVEDDSSPVHFNYYVFIFNSYDMKENSRDN